MTSWPSQVHTIGLADGAQVVMPQKSEECSQHAKLARDCCGGRFVCGLLPFIELLPGRTTRLGAETPPLRRLPLYPVTPPETPQDFTTCH